MNLCARLGQLVAIEALVARPYQTARFEQSRAAITMESVAMRTR